MGRYGRESLNLTRLAGHRVRACGMAARLSPLLETFCLDTLSLIAFVVTPLDRRLSVTKESHVFLSANSTATLTSSTSSTQTLIKSNFSQLKEDGKNTTRVPETGHYVTTIGNAKVVWRREDGSVEVLTILAPSG
jgi:hypothetical protein